jgi:hypothetical protein
MRIRIGGWILIRQTPGLGGRLMPAGLAKQSRTKLKPPEFFCSKRQNKVAFCVAGKLHSTGTDLCQRKPESDPNGQHTSEFKITPDHLNMLNKSGERHKYDYGHAIIVSGPQGQCGAARLPPPSGIVVCHCDVSEIITQRESIHVINKAAAVPKSPDNGHTKARMFN